MRPRPQESPKPQTQEETRAAARALAEQRRAAEQPAAAPRREPVTVGAQSGAQRPLGGQQGSAPQRPAPSQPSFDDDDLDIPDFLK